MFRRFMDFNKYLKPIKSVGSGKITHRKKNPNEFQYCSLSSQSMWSHDVNVYLKRGQVHCNHKEFRNVSTKFN